MSGEEDEDYEEPDPILVNHDFGDAGNGDNDRTKQLELAPGERPIRVKNLLNKKHGDVL